MLRLFVGLLGSVFAVLFLCVPAGAIEKKASSNIQGKSSNTVWSIHAQTGYQHTDMHFSAPFTRSNLVGFELFTRSSLDLELHNADLWVGGIGADIKKGRFSGFLELNANRPRDTNFSSSSEPFWGGLNPVNWNGCPLNWWAINAGAGFDVTSNFTIQAGLKVERLSLGINNPIDSMGTIPRFKSLFGDSYSGKLDSNLLIPWVGVRGQVRRLSGSLRFSPFAHTDLRIPFIYGFVATPLIGVERDNYSFDHNGIWLESSLAYDIYKSATWSCSLWAQASWLWTNGSTLNTYQAVMYLPGSNATTVFIGSSSVEGTYYTGNYAVGLRINYDFR